jgi:hypothetical protein
MDKEKFDLEQLPKANIFQIPDNYFEDLPRQIQARTTAIKPIVPFVSWSVQRTWVALAAMSAVAILGYFTLMPKQDALGSEALSGVQNQEIVNYLIQEDLNQGDIAENTESTKTAPTEDTELLDNLKVSDKEILQSIDVEDIEEAI